MTPDEFRRRGHELIDWLADTRQRIYAGEVPALSKIAPGELRGALPGAPPESGESFEAIASDLERLILPACSHFQHPRFFAYFPSNTSLASVLGDYVSTGLGQLGLNWASSPALTELEQVTTDWFRQMLGLSSSWNGVIQDTASTTTLVALLCARERASGHSSATGGLQAQPAPLVVYASAHAHSSIEKAALLAGFGRDNLRMIGTDAEHALRADVLAETIETDLKAGSKPAAIVATVGTTTTTAIDPIAPLAEIARRHGVWLHVDAALAGSAMILPECRTLWSGVESADSLVINPHKWLGAAFDCTLYYVRDSQCLVRVMSTNPSYLRTAADGQAINYRDWGIPLGRRFRALKLWFLIREQGVAGLQVRLRRDIANAQWLKERVDSAPGWRRLAPVPLQTVCVRHEPGGARRRCSRSAHARLVRSDQFFGRGLADARGARWTLDGACLDRRGGDRAAARRGSVGTHARGDDMKTRTWSIALLALFGSGVAAAQGQDFSKVVIETHKLAEGVYMLTGAGGNIGVSAGEDGVAIIDDQFAPLTPKVQEALAKLNAKPARFVINTHWHGDHTGGNENFGKAGAVIVAHDNVRKRMSERHFSEFFKRETPPSPKDALPVITFAQDVTLHLNGETLHVFHVANAHTDGDGLIYFRNANVLHMGDTFFNGMYPFIDAGSGGGIDGAIAAADKVLGMVGAQTKIIPGHGPLATRADLEKYRAMLATLRDRVTKLIRDGKTLEQAMAEKPTADLDATWAKGFFKPEQIVQMVYLDLKRTVK